MHIPDSNLRAAIRARRRSSPSCTSVWGAAASFEAAVVENLPKTRAGKILHGTRQKIA